MQILDDRVNHARRPREGWRQPRDFPIVLGFLVISSVLLMIGNLVSDLVVALVDPRVRFE